MATPSAHPVLIGASPAMAEVRRFVARAAGVSAPVLLLGETGTGKSLLARIIHASGARSAGPFVSVNCAAVPETLFESELFGHRRGAFTGAHEDRVGLIESAGSGTLLLDEVGDLPAPQQAKLLSVLEEGEVRPVGSRRTARVDARVLSATASPLERRVADGAFRRDLFHRLTVLSLRLPPLRERPGDLAPLAEHFLRAAAERHRMARPRLDRPSLHLLEGHSWPGNVRELGHALEAALILAPEQGFAGALAARLHERAAEAAAGGAPPPPPTTTPPDPSERYSFYGSSDEERGHIRAALARCRGNRTLAARELGMARNTLRDRMRRYGL